MSGIFGRVINWFANEFIVNTLANSRSFQRLALKIDAFLSKQQSTIKNIGDDAIKKGSERADDLHRKTVESTGFDFKKFIATIQEEIAKDVKPKK